MLLWDRALIQACASYPNMRVYDWAAAAKDSWFISDGIHYTSAGYAARANLIAHALAAAFPARGLTAKNRAPNRADEKDHAPSCLVLYTRR